MEKNDKTVNEEKKIPIWQIIVAAAACLVLLVCLTVVLWWSIAGVKSFDEGMGKIKALFASQEKKDPTAQSKPKEEKPYVPQGGVFTKESYTADDTAASGNTVLTIGDTAYTNSQLQVYYWMTFYQRYAYDYQYGLNLMIPLDQQTCAYNNGGTWQQYYLDRALNNMLSYGAMVKKANEANFKLDAEDQKVLDEMPQTVEKDAKDAGCDTVQAYLDMLFGPGTTYQDYYDYMSAYYISQAYYAHRVSSVEITDEMVEQYGIDHEAEIIAGGVEKEDKIYAVRHILYEVKSSADNGTYSDADWEACREKAQKLLDQWLAGKHTEKSFEDLAVKYSEDPGVKENKGLYTGLTKNTNFVEPFKEWYLDASRKVGDYGLVKTVYGYHIMYYAAEESAWEAVCLQGVREDVSNGVLEEVTTAYATEIRYEDILLGSIDLGN